MHISFKDRSKSAYLVIRDWCLSVVGKLHQRVQVGAQVRLTADQQHLSVGAKLLDLPFPLWRETKAYNCARLREKTAFPLYSFKSSKYNMSRTSIFCSFFPNRPHRNINQKEDLTIAFKYAGWPERPDTRSHEFHPPSPAF